MHSRHRRMFGIGPGRGLLVLAIALSVSALVACGGRNADSDGPSGVSDANGRWSFTTSGTDRTVKLQAEPENLVVDYYSAAALWEYGIRPDGVFGYRFSDERTLSMRPDRMTVVGTDGELDLEALLGLDPDLIIGYGNPDGTAWAWWDEKVSGQVEQIAPFLGIRFGSGRHPGEIIEEYRELAGELGGDPQTPEVLRAKRTFDSRLDRLRELAKREPKLRILPLHAQQDQVWVGHRVLGQLALLEDIGFRLVGPGNDDEAFTEINWETIADHPADIVLTYAGMTEETREHPTYSELPAVRAGQVVTWDDKRPYTYPSYNEWLGDLIDVLRDAERVGRAGS